MLNKNQRKMLQKLLLNNNNGQAMEPPIMIFVNMKKNADTLAKYLRSQSFGSISLHGGKSQENREYALKQFKLHEYDILVCTNVAVNVNNGSHKIIKSLVNITERIFNETFNIMDNDRCIYIFILLYLQISVV